MLTPRITLNGMYVYDPTLFDDIVLPSGMDKELMIRQIIRQSGDLFPFYQVPAQVKQATTDWFARRLSNFEKLYSGYTADYNPIENYDRHEETTESPDITHTIENTGTDSSTNTADVQGFDSDSYVPNSKTTSGGTSTTRGTDKETGTRKTESRVHGNIGVTTSAQMLAEETRLRASFDLYVLIATEYETDNLLQVY